MLHSCRGDDARACPCQHARPDTHRVRGGRRRRSAARNCCVRCSRGAVKICSGGPCSRITPPSRKQTRSAISRAKAISWVAISIVIPPVGELADHLEHLADELRVERARDLVEQHQLGLHRERAHDRDALLLAAREPVGVLVALVGEPEAAEQLERALPRPRAARRPSAVCGRERHVPRARVMCGKRLNAWKTIPIRRRIAVRVDAAAGDLARRRARSGPRRSARSG